MLPKQLRPFCGTLHQGKPSCIPRSSQVFRTSQCRCLSAQVAEQQTKYGWSGEDEFTPLDDRKDLPPLPLPDIDMPRRVVLVRHGQSTWNAEGRIQGSSDFSKLTPKGMAQAETTRDMLKDERFNALIVSPLTRARETVEIITQESDLEAMVLPALREVDLYSFQGLLKAEGKAQFGSEFTAWQKAAHQFSIDGHAPVRELWHRASLAWHTILSATDPEGDPALTTLVVAHNAVNQALIASALGLPPAYFRRLLQSNAATTVMDFEPTGPGGSPPRVTLDRLNQSPGRPYQPDGAGRQAAGRLVLVRHAATGSSAREEVLLGSRDEGLSGLGFVQAGKTAELLLDMKVSKVFTSPARRCALTAKLIAELQVQAGPSGPSSSSSSSGEGPAILMLEELRNLELGLWEGLPPRMVRGQSMPEDAEDLEEFWSRTAAAFERLRAAVAEGETPGGPASNVVVVAHAAVMAALAAHGLGLGPEALPLFRFDTGGVSIMDFPDGAAGPTTPTPTAAEGGTDGSSSSSSSVGGHGVMRTINYTAHLGRWAVPITRDDLDGVCGIDGCF